MFWYVCGWRKGERRREGEEGRKILKNIHRCCRYTNCFENIRTLPLGFAHFWQRAWDYSSPHQRDDKLAETVCSSKQAVIITYSLEKVARNDNNFIPPLPENCGVCIE